MKINEYFLGFYLDKVTGLGEETTGKLVLSEIEVLQESVYTINFIIIMRILITIFLIIFNYNTRWRKNKRRSQSQYLGQIALLPNLFSFLQKPKEKCYKNF